MSRLGPSASAERISSRLVSDLEPGTVTVASSGPPATGACQRPRAERGEEGNTRRRSSVSTLLNAFVETPEEEHMIATLERAATGTSGGLGWPRHRLARDERSGPG